MRPSERAFVTAVVHYQRLVHRHNDPTERSRLERFLGSGGPIGPERRKYRRLPVMLRAVVREDGLDSPCTVLDISAGGMKIRNDSGCLLRSGAKVIVSIETGAQALRVDLPSEVRHVTPGGRTLGIRFVGAPLVMHQRRGARAGARSDASGATAEVPIARDWESVA